MSKKFKLRPYQKENSKQITDILKDSNSVLYQLPTGGGKTVVIQDIVEKIVNGDITHIGKKILILVHRREIIFQIRRRLSEQGIESGLLIGNLEENLDADILVGSILTVARDARLERILSKGYDFMIIDESHHARSNSYDKVINFFEEFNPSYKLLGVTATPYRKDKKDLGQAFSKMVLGPSISELQEMGYLCKAKTYLTNLPDIDDEVTVSGGDYNITELSKFMRNPEVIKHAIEAYKELGEGKQMLTFCVDKKHALEVKDAYIEAGFTKIGHIDSDTKTSERDNIIQGYRDGEIDIITSIQTLTEGVDLPETQVLQYLRPTLSLVLYLQMGGRGLRPKKDGSELIVLDIANCSQKHGLLDTNREWNLNNINPNIKTKRNKIVGKRGDGSVTEDVNEIDAENLALLELSPEEVFLRRANGLQEAEENNRKVKENGYKKYIEVIDFLNEKFKSPNGKFIPVRTIEELSRDLSNLNKIQFQIKNNGIFDIVFEDDYVKINNIVYTSSWNSNKEEEIENLKNYVVLGKGAEFIGKKRIQSSLIKMWEKVFEVEEDLVDVNGLKSQIETFKNKQVELELNEMFANGIYEIELNKSFRVCNYNRNYDGNGTKLTFEEKPKRLKVNNKVNVEGARNAWGYYSYRRREENEINSKTFNINKENIINILKRNGYKNPLSTKQEVVKA